jgi:hypothetical protein
MPDGSSLAQKTHRQSIDAFARRLPSPVCARGVKVRASTDIIARSRRKTSLSTQSIPHPALWATFSRTREKGNSNARRS